MSSTSAIETLPNEASDKNIVQKTPQNVNNTTYNPKIDVVQEQPKNMQELSKESINQIIQGIQNASSNNLTSLPSRDIPQNTDHLTQDKQVKPNFIPEATNDNYIEQNDTFDTLMKKRADKKKEQFALDQMYEEIQTPILIMILFFFFQLPYFKKLMIKHVPSMVNTDLNINMSGYVFKTFLFGLSYYAINKVTQYLSFV